MAERPLGTTEKREPLRSNDLLSGVHRIAAERQRQIDQEGWNEDHDDEHKHGELYKAAVCYALFNSPQFCGDIWRYWPWEQEWWKPDAKDAIRNLEKAGALIAAEIDRLQRTLAR